MTTAPSPATDQPDQSWLSREIPCLWFSLGASLLLLYVVLETCAPILTHAQLEPDDFRFVARALGLRTSEGLGFAVLENRWDALPFVDVEGSLRFFRPILPWSFALDARASHGFTAAGQGLDLQARFEPIVLTNILLHASCVLLALGLCVRTVGCCLAAFLGALFFACFAPHAEAIWYGSGRNATLLGIAFVGAWLAHTSPGQRSWTRILAVAAFATALLCKESAVVLLPLLWWHDRVHQRRNPRGLWLAYGSVLLAYLILRTLALGSVSGSSLIEPYIYAPWSPSFLAHAATSVAASLDAVALGTRLDPFLRPQDLFERNSILGMLLGAGALIVMIVVLRHERDGKVLLAFAGLSYLVTLPLYISERYLYLPSFAVSAMLALLLLVLAQKKAPLPVPLPAPLPRYPPQSLLAYAAALLITLASYWQGSILLDKHRWLCNAPRYAWALSAALAPLRPELSQTAQAPSGNASKHRFLVLDFPSDVVHAQFFEDQLRVEFNDPQLEIRVLNLLPEAASMQVPTQRLETRRPRPGRLELHGVGRPVLERGGLRRLFPIIDLARGSSHASHDQSVTLQVVAGDGQQASSLRFELRKGFEGARILRYQPPTPDLRFASSRPSVRISYGRFVLESGRSR